MSVPPTGGPSDPLPNPDAVSPVVRRRRPGAGQSTRRASRGWHPDTIVAAYLMPDERVRLEETRSVRGFLVAQLHWVLLGAAAVVLALSVGNALLSAVALLGGLALALWLGAEALRAWFTRYVVTDLRVLRVRGVLNRHAEFIPWGKVTEITRSETLLQWWAHTATIRIESANDRSAFRSIDDVDDPGTFYQVLVDMLDRKQGRVRTDR